MSAPCEQDPGPIESSPSVRILDCNSVQPVLVEILPIAPARSADAVQFQRDAARRALTLCARQRGAPPTGWSQSPDGAPLPNDGWHWSVSHKRRWAGAVIDRGRIGIDIESIIPRTTELFDEIATRGEWERIGGRTWDHFFLAWTAKEATLKANGLGIGAIRECTVVGGAPSKNDAMTLELQGRPWHVEYAHFDDHVVAVSRPARRGH